VPTARHLLLVFWLPMDDPAPLRSVDFDPKVVPFLLLPIPSLLLDSECVQQVTASRRFGLDYKLVSVLLVTGFSLALAL